MVTLGFVLCQIASWPNENGFVLLLYAFRLETKVRNAGTSYEKSPHFGCSCFVQIRDYPLVLIEIHFDVATSVGFRVPFRMV